MNKKLAVISGAAGGMGYASAVALSPNYEILLTDLNGDVLGARAETFKIETGLTALTYVCDLSSQPAVDGLVKIVRDTPEQLGAIVHCAGISPMMASWEKVIDVDLVGSARLLNGLLPFASMGAAVVNIASIAAVNGPAIPEVDAVLRDPLADDLLEQLVKTLPMEMNSGIAYCLAKRGVVFLSERLAVDWGPKGVRVVSVSPGPIDTEMGRLELEKNPLIEPSITKTPLQRPDQDVLPGRIEDITNVVCFLCSERAGFISGCDLRVDGGLVSALAQHN